MTCPPLAAFITGIVRAAVSEIIADLPRNRPVLSVTTDGFLTDATHADIDAATANGPICQLLAKSRKALTGDAKVVEIKRQVQQPFVWRTRGTATLSSEDPPILAQGGIQAAGTARQRNDYVLERVIRRKAYPKLPQSRATTLREIVEENEYFRTGLSADVSANRDFDFKRELVRSQEVSTTCGAHLRAQTRPWDSYKQFLAERGLFEGWYKRDNRLVTGADWSSYEDWKAAAGARQQGLRGAPLEISTRALISEVARSPQLRSSLSDAKVARLIQQLGIPCTTATVKDGKRHIRTLDLTSLPQTPEVLGRVDLFNRFFGHLQVVQELEARGLTLKPEKTRLPTFPAEGILSLPIHFPDLAERLPDGRVRLMATRGGGKPRIASISVKVAS
jgi:hypothetical protein